MRSVRKFSVYPWLKPLPHGVLWLVRRLRAEPILERRAPYLVVGRAGQRT
jgi:hypothetical protein